MSAAGQITIFLPSHNSNLMDSFFTIQSLWSRRKTEIEKLHNPLTESQAD